MKQKKIKFTVRRKNWLRGVNSCSYLLNKNGSMCCLGFLGRACGLKTIDLLHRNSPDSCDQKRHLYPKSIVNSRNTKLCQKIIDCNDEVYLPVADKEKQLKALFAEGGIEVTFK